MHVPFLDLLGPSQALMPALEEACRTVLKSGRYIGGPAVESFESAFATFCKTKHTIGTGNGLDALIIALEAAGIGRGDKVMVPSHTFIATWLAVTRLGADVVPIEVDPATYTLNPELLEAAMTPEVKAIIPVHLYGLPADMDPILAFAKAHNLVVLADAAQAHGALYKGQPVGALCPSAWSFYPGKNLGAYGDAGAITCADDNYANACHWVGNYGSPTKYVHEVCGTNSRLDPLQAALLTERLKVLPQWNKHRTNVAKLYTAGLCPDVAKPTVPAYATPAWHLYVVRTPKREALQKHLAAAGIETLIHYPTAIHKQRCYATEAKQWGPLPLAEELANTVLSLPMGPHLTDEQVQHVITTLNQFYQG